MDPSVVSIFLNTGPVGVLAYILWHSFSRHLDAANEFHANLIAESKADREALREELSAMRAQAGRRLDAISDDLEGLRDEIRQMPPVPVVQSRHGDQP